MFTSTDALSELVGVWEVNRFLDSLFNYITSSMPGGSSLPTQVESPEKVDVPTSTALAALGSILLSCWN